MPQPDPMTLPARYSVRRARDQDAQPMLDLVMACDLFFGKQPSGYTLEDVREGWSNLDRERNTWAIIAPDGALAAYGELTDRGSGKLIADGYVHPAHRGLGLGTALARAMEARARELVADAPDGARVSVTNGVLLVDQGACELLERDGYTVVRTFWEMRVTLAEEPAAPTLPAGLRLRAFVPGQDERAVYESMQTAFEDHWGHTRTPYEEWVARTTRSDFDPALWLVIETADGAIPAALLGTMRTDHGWINTVGTLREWRGRGLASALLRASFRVFWQRGMRVVGLGVDAQNPTGATRVYEAAGMAPVVSAVVYEKLLRDGVDLGGSGAAE
ncbi:MAG TPA: GNAT family N-acetyltransferase [Ktedonobacterales bacterium]